MRTLRTSLFLAIMAVLALGSVQALAHGLVTGENSCTLCHTTFVQGGASHSAHAGFVPECTDCHTNGVGVDPVAVNTCVACHDAPDMFVAHGSLQYGDPILQCGYCHEGVANESHSWSSLKNIFE